MSGMYEARVHSFDTVSKQAKCIIPQLFDNIPVLCDPFLPTERHRSRVLNLVPGDVVMVLWDGDQPNAIPKWLSSPVALRWNSAWGQQSYTGDASASFQDIPAASSNFVLNNTTTTFKFESGRRYKVSYSARAFSGTTAAPASGRLFLVDSVAGTTLLSSLDRWVGVADIDWGSINVNWIVDGDGVSRSIQVRVDQNPTAMRIYSVGILIEDIGPSTPGSGPP